MTKPIAVIPGDFPPQTQDSEHLDRISALVDLRIFDTVPQSVDDQVQRVEDAEIIINSRGSLRWPAEVLERLPRLQFFTTVSIGTDSVDLGKARELGIVVSNVPGRTAGVVAEHALALLMTVAKRLTVTTGQMKQYGWTDGESTLLAGKTLGIIGAGSIGCAMIRLAQAIGMKVRAWTFHPSDDRAAELGVEFVELDELLRTVDAVSVHVKLTEQSRGLLGREQLMLMKPGSLLVNTARGPIVDADALVEALENGHLGGAGLDVFHTEPLPAEDPILGCENVVLSPHSADQNPEGRSLLNGGAVDNVLAFLRGDPQNVVN